MGDTYATNSLMQMTAAGKAISEGMFRKAITVYHQEHPEIFCDTTNTFRIADFGCADACNSLFIYEHLIELVREISPGKPIEILCSDLEKTNWQKLFENVSGLKQNYDNVFFSVAAGSFYTQIFASSSVDFAFCCTSIHWLSKAPCFIPTYTYHTFEEYPEIDAEKVELWRRSTSDDLKTFYQHRHRELRPGGSIFVTTVGTSDPPSEQDKKGLEIRDGREKYFLEVIQKYHLEDLKDDLMAPVCNRQLKDFLPHANNEGAQFEVLEGRDHGIYLEALVKLLQAGGPEMYQKKAISSFNAVIGPFYRGQLLSSGKTDEECEEIVKDLIEAICGHYGQIPMDEFPNTANYHLLLWKKV